MSKFCVRSVDKEDSLQISLELANNGGVSRMFNACRPKSENIGNTLSRLAANINKHLNKKKRKTTSGTEQREVIVDLFQSDGVTKIPQTESAENALCSGNIISILEEKYVVDVNPPCCLSITIPQCLMVGFPVFPKFDVEFCNLDDSEYVWEKIKYVEAEENSAQSGKPNKPDPAKVIDRQEVCRNLSYTPTNDDIGYRLSVTVTPKSGERFGRSLTTESKFDVTAGPGVCPFETRHLYTQKKTQQGE